MVGTRLSDEAAAAMERRAVLEIFVQDEEDLRAFGKRLLMVFAFFFFSFLSFRRFLKTFDAMCPVSSGCGVGLCGQ